MSGVFYDLSLFSLAMGNDQGNNFGAVMIFGVAKAIEHNLRCFLIVLILVSIHHIFEHQLFLF
jgi:hypothetical protein